MATFSKVLLSGSSGGQLVKVAATATPGTTIHTTGISATVMDEVWLYCSNTSATDVKVTLEFGGTTSPDDLVEFTVTAESGLFLLVPGLLQSGTGSVGRTISAFADTVDVVNIGGYVNRITP